MVLEEKEKRGARQERYVTIDLVRVVGLETYLVYIKLARARLVCRELQAGNIVHYLEYYYHKMASVVTHQVMENSCCFFCREANLNWRASILFYKKF